MKQRIPKFDDFQLNEAEKFRFMDGVMVGVDPYEYFMRHALLWKSTRKFSNELMAIIQKETGVKTQDEWKDYSDEEKTKMIEFMTPYIKEFAKERPIKVNDIVKYLSGCESHKDVNDKKKWRIFIGDVTGTPLNGRGLKYTDLDFHMRIDWGGFPANFNTGEKPREYVVVYNPTRSIVLFPVKNGKITFDKLWLTSMDSTYQETKWLDQNVKIKKELR